MLIIWKGAGFFIAVLTFAWLLLLDWSTAAIFGENYYGRNGWPKLVGLWAAATTVFLLRRLFGVQTIVDEGFASHEEDLRAAATRESQLFFIRARYWPVVLVLLGIVFFFVRD